MRTVGYWMEYLLTRTREETVLLAAIAELNMEETAKQSERKG